MEYIIMIVSNLDKRINYERKGILDKLDIGYIAQVYKVEILDVIYYIALGKPNRKFIDYNIIFFPIYVIVFGKVAAQLGVYEIPNGIFKLSSESQKYIYDVDGDLNINKLGKPVLYPDFRLILNKINDNVLIKGKELKNKLIKSPSSSQSPQSSESYISSNLSGESSNSESSSKKRTQTRKTSKIFEDKSKGTRSRSRERSDDDNWIQKYLMNKSGKYRIQDNEGGGDCLFAVIRDGFKASDLDKRIVDNVSVNNLRKLVVDHITEDQFLEYKRIYEDLKNEQTLLRGELLEKEKELLEGNDTYNDGKKVGEIKEKIMENEDLIVDFQEAEDIKSLDDYKKQFLECNFWANGAAINQLEKILNIKLIIFSHTNFVQKNYNNVIQCGEITEYESGKGPLHYILVDYLDNIHYKLIKYKSDTSSYYKGIFIFDELPKEIVEKVKEQCLQRKSGAFYVIPEFQRIADT